MKHNRLYKKNVGFSLLEVLIAVVILAIGLLGIAGMQVISLKNNHSAYMRSQASLLGYEFADILRSNMKQVEADKFGTSASGNIDIDTSSLGFNTVANCTGSGCSSDKMAENDLALWAMKINATLPSGMARVDRSGDIYIVSIFWLDDRSDTDGAGIDVDGNGESDNDLNLTDNIDGVAGNDVVVTGNEANFKQLTMSFEP